MKPQAIERLTGRDISTVERRSALFKSAVIISGGAADWPAMRKLQLSEIKRAFGRVKVPVRETDDEFKVFFGNRPQEVGPRQMVSLAEYVDAIQRTDNRGKRPPYAGNISLLTDPAVRRHLGSLPQECRFPDLGLPNHTMEYRLWIAAGGQRSTIHNDAYHNLNAQIVGRKRFIVFAPDQHAALYPVFFHQGMWASPIDPTAPDLARYPDFAGAQVFSAELEPGDILYLPRFWWHCAEALTTCVNVNQWHYLDGPLQWWHEQPEARRFIESRQVPPRETS